MFFQRIHIELTNRCNFSCVFCPNNLMTRPRQDLPLVFVRKALDEISRNKLTDTIFFHVMGEPTLYPQLSEVVKEAKERDLKVVLTTNGWGLSSELLDKILNLEIDQILFSVQTPDECSYQLRQVPVVFSEYKRTVCAFISHALNHGKTKVTLSFLTTPLPFFSLPSKSYKIICRKKELVDSFLSWIEEITSTLESESFKRQLSSKKDLIIKKLSSFSLLGWNKLNLTSTFSLETRVLGDWVHRGLIDDKVVGAAIGSCEGLKTHFGILSNGDMVFCCVDFDGKTRFGNIGEMSICDAFRQKKVLDALNGFKKCLVKEPYCKRCLGDASFEKSWMRQLGSIAYFKVYRPFWEEKRKKEEALLCP